MKVVYHDRYRETYSSGPHRRPHACMHAADKYVDSIIKCSEFVKGENPDEAELKRWFFASFPQTRGEKAVMGYVNIIANQLGLIKMENGEFVLSSDSEKFLSTRDNKFLFLVLDQRVNSVRELEKACNEKKTQN